MIRAAVSDVRIGFATLELEAASAKAASLSLPSHSPFLPESDL